jgi:hypothetical protein
MEEWKLPNALQPCIIPIATTYEISLQQPDTQQKKSVLHQPISIIHLTREKEIMRYNYQIVAHIDSTRRQ